MLKGFKEFILRGNVVDLAIAVVVGTLFADVVKAFVADILTPLVAAIAGKPNFANLEFKVHHSTFLYGDLLNTIVSFLLVAIVIYFMVVMPLNKIAERRAKGNDTAAEIAEDVVLLTQIRDLLAAQSGVDPTAPSTPAPTS